MSIRTRLLAVVTAALIAASLFALPSLAAYADQDQIPSWARADVQFTTQAGVFRGDAQTGRFRPGDQITRAELAAIVMRASSPSVDPSIRVPFTDIQGGWYEGEVTRAVQAGVIAPSDFGSRFRPDQPITRAEMARMVVRAVESSGQGSAPRSMVPFTDVDPDEAPFGPFIAKAAACGIIKGMGDGTFAPDQTATRAQAAVMIARMMRLEQSNGQNEFELRVYGLVNQEREAAGLSPLRLDPELSRVARLKSQDFIENDYFDHTSPTYGGPFEMMKQFGITFRSAGENIAMGQRTPEQVHKSWMSSSGHRANILNPNYDTIGIGFYENAWTQMFIQSR